MIVTKDRRDVYSVKLEPIEERKAREYAQKHFELLWASILDPEDAEFLIKDGVYKDRLDYVVSAVENQIETNSEWYERVVGTPAPDYVKEWAKKAA